MTIARRAFALLLPLAALAACSDSQITAPERAEPRTAAAAAPAPACLEFNVPPLGTWFGGPPWGTPAYTPLWVENGITAYVGTFNDGVNPPIYGAARVELPSAPFGVGPTGLARSIVWGFDFSTLPFVPSAVTFEWLDLYNSPVENLRVNGALFIGQIIAPPAVLGGSPVGVGGIVPVGGGFKGQIKIGAPITRIEVGGQPIWVDRVCAYP